MEMPLAIRELYTLREWVNLIYSHLAAEDSRDGAVDSKIQKHNRDSFTDL